MREATTNTFCKHRGNTEHTAEIKKNLTQCHDISQSAHNFLITPYIRHLQRETILPKLLCISLLMAYTRKTVPTISRARRTLELFKLLLFFLEPKFLQCQAFQTKCSSSFQILLVLTFVIWRRSARTATCPGHRSQACNFNVQECIIIRPQHRGELRKCIYCSLH
jgi:hypothetical protein